MAFETQDVAKEAKNAQPSESSSLFGEVSQLMGRQQLSASDLGLQNSQNTVNQMFGSLELFDSAADARNDGGRTPTFKRDKPDPDRPEVPFEPTPEFARKVVDEFKKFDVPGHIKQIPGELNRQLGEIARVWGFE